MYSELWATLRDWRECGDLRGHLWAWLELARGRVTVGDRARVGTIVPTTPADPGSDLSGQGTTVPTDPDARRARIVALWQRIGPEERAVVLRLLEALAR